MAYLLRGRPDLNVEMGDIVTFNTEGLSRTCRKNGTKTGGNQSELTEKTGIQNPYSE